MSVTLYEDDRAGGAQYTFHTTIADLRTWNWNDTVSSLTNDETVYFYEDINFGGAGPWEVPPGKHPLGELADYGIPNDVISSFVIPGTYYTPPY
jgi:hypothetical protein